MALSPTLAKDALESGSPGNNQRVPTPEEIVEDMTFKTKHGRICTVQAIER